MDTASNALLLKRDELAAQRDQAYAAMAEARDLLTDKKIPPAQFEVLKEKHKEAHRLWQKFVDDHRVELLALQQNQP